MAERRVPFTEFRRNASRLLDEVESGETLVLLRHGKAVARLAPADDLADEVPSWKREPLRLGRPGASLVDAILAEREEGW